jgi:hypothetical protein
MEVKYSSKQIKQMNETELQLSAGYLLIKINIITGWNFPTEIEHQNILEDQFRKKLIESYPNVNLDEIEYAFRNNTSVKDWGKNINLGLVDEVMIPYLNQRRQLSDLEERMTPIELPAPPDEPITDEEWIDLCRSSYRMLKNYRVISKTAIKILFKEGKIKRPCEEDCEIIKRQATHDYHQDLIEDKSLKWGDKEEIIKKMMNQILVAKFFNDEMQKV